MRIGGASRQPVESAQLVVPDWFVGNQFDHALELRGGLVRLTIPSCNTNPS